ncbi:MAG: 3-oxoacid CoA-transferase subunit A [Filifactor alocis]|nr:3-oxoacid CoA-transferase subunit A [Filifactor alocis]
MNKIITVSEAVDQIKDGMTIMVGGFLGDGTPHSLVNEIAKRGIKDITLICNDTAFVDYGTGIWVNNHQVKKTIASHVGTNKQTGIQMADGSMVVELVPQGSLAEKIRCGGFGLGAAITPTGVGTAVEEGKQKITIEGIEYLVEPALRADIALIYGAIVDKRGNVVYHKTGRNFNPLMAMAADKVIVEAGQIVEVGEIDPNDVMTSGIVVDHIVQGEPIKDIYGEDHWRFQ